jgi:hypothetical protein
MTVFIVYIQYTAINLVIQINGGKGVAQLTHQLGVLALVTTLLHPLHVRKKLNKGGEERHRRRGGESKRSMERGALALHKPTHRTALLAVDLSVSLARSDLLGSLGVWGLHLGPIRPGPDDAKQRSLLDRLALRSFLNLLGLRDLPGFWVNHIVS